MPQTTFSAQKFLFLSFLFSFFFIAQNLHSQQKTLGVTKYLKGHQEDGYVLYSAVGSDTTFLINKCGKKVHKWVSQYGPGLSLYLLPNGHLLRTGSYQDTGFGIAGGRGGIIEEFDWDNKLLWRYKLFNDSLCQHHDITPLPNGNILILAWHAISKTKAIALGRDSNSFANGSEGLWGERILEIKPYGLDSANIIWQWDLFDHIIQDKKPTLPNYGVVNQHPELLNINYALNLKTFDWIHANGLDYNPDLDQIVISCHNISEFWIIDHSTSISQAKSHTGGRCGKGGDLLYRWGNPEAYKNGTSADRKLFRQHNTHWVTSGQDSGAIMLFNNGWDRDSAYSSVEVIRTTINSSGTSYGNTIPYGPTAQNWIYKDSIPTDFYSKIISGSQRLPNGNTLICSGVQGRFFEITPQKKTVWEYRCPINVMSQTVQSDGDVPVNNSVFRCEFYRNNYQGLSGRVLTPFGTVEKNPYPFACNYDRTPPKVLSLTPPKAQTLVGPNPVLKITFSEPVTKKTGNIQIFQNKTLIETIAITSTKIKVTGSQVTIQQSVPFALNSKIAILVPANAFSDSAYNLSGVLDTSAWYFFTETRFSSVAFNPPHLSINRSPFTPVSITFTDSILKGAGSIYLYENAVLKEQIPVGNSNITINGKTANIFPTTPFSQDANVSIVVESCFKNAKGGLNTPVASGSWTFKTLTSPQITKLSPAHLANNVSVSTSLSIDFDRPIKVGNPNYLLIYENDVLIDSIMVNGPRAMISGNFINFDLNSDFTQSSYISIALRPNAIQDTMGAYFSGIDSSQWHFNVETKASISNSAIVNGFKVYPNPGHDLFRISSAIRLESAELFTLTGQKIPITLFRLNDNKCELRLKDAVSGHYMLLLNGSYTVMIEVQ